MSYAKEPTGFTSATLGSRRKENGKFRHLTAKKRNRCRNFYFYCIPSDGKKSNLHKFLSVTYIYTALGGRSYLHTLKVVNTIVFDLVYYSF